MGHLLNKAQLKLEEMENKAHEVKGRAKQKAKDSTSSDETADTY